MLFRYHANYFGLGLEIQGQTQGLNLLLLENYFLLLCYFPVCVFRFGFYDLLDLIFDLISDLVEQ